MISYTYRIEVRKEEGVLSYCAHLFPRWRVGVLFVCVQLHDVVVRFNDCATGAALGCRNSALLIYA